MTFDEILRARLGPIFSDYIDGAITAQEAADREAEVLREEVGHRPAT